MIIRDPRPDDEAAWRRLWAGYTAFYQTDVPEAVTRHTWNRILDPASPMFARLAESEGQVIGFTVNVLHEGTWNIRPVCYLEDLFVDASQRGHGVGQRLIQDLLDLAHAKRWAQLYWNTQTGNPARKLYDRFIKADDFVRYRISVE